jgi:hypothetical protein
VENHPDQIITANAKIRPDGAAKVRITNTERAAKADVSKAKHAK